MKTEYIRIVKYIPGDGHGHRQGEPEVGDVLAVACRDRQGDPFVVKAGHKWLLWSMEDAWEPAEEPAEEPREAVNFWYLLVDGVALGPFLSEQATRGFIKGEGLWQGDPLEPGEYEVVKMTGELMPTAKETT